MTRKEANQMRCIAHEIIIKLKESGNQTCVSLLRQHCEAALRDMPPPPTENVMVHEPNDQG